MSSTTSSFSSSECQLSTHFTCQCLKCVGAFTSTNNNNNNSEEDLYQLQFTTTVSAPTSVLLLNSSFISQEEEEGEEERLLNNTKISVEEVEQEKEITQQQEENISRSANNKKISRRQKKQKHQKSFLDIAKSLRDSPKPFRNKPASIQTCFTASYSWQTEEMFNERIQNERRQKRRILSRLRRRQYLPDWCYNYNETSMKSVRDLAVVFVGGEEEYFVYDRRATMTAIRLPRSTAIAHRNKNRWIVRHRIFNCKKPFSNMLTNWSDEATLNKADTRGLTNWETEEKFHSKDGRERYNRNGGHHRRSYRGNNYHQGKQVYMGNSRKNIFGKPWLHNRAKKIHRGEDRLRESGWIN